MNEPNRPGVLRDVAGILTIAFSLFASLALATYSSHDPSFINAVAGKREVVNLGGMVGAYLSDILVQMFGTGSFFFPIITLILGWALIRGKQFHAWPLVVSSGIVFLFSLCALIAAQLETDPYFGPSVPTGGMAGTWLASFLVLWLNRVGATLILATFIFSSLLAMTRVSVNTLIDRIREGAQKGFHSFTQGVTGMKDWGAQWVEQWKTARKEKREEEFYSQEPIILTPMLSPPKAAASVNKRSRKKVDIGEEEFFIEEELPDPVQTGDYQIPPPSLLEDPPAKEHSDEIREEILAHSATLEQKLADFGILGRVVQVLPGPVITLFEFEPAPGVKVSRIVSLTDDLALAMRATSLRILAPVPGKPVVGIEIPNSLKDTVYFKEILSSSHFIETDFKLPLAIGKDHIGQPVVQDLTSIPHLLIAGSTGSGKSVGLNAMICSILLNASPDEVKMILVDPKMLELSIYDGLPHLISPVVTNPKKAAAALQWAVAEMESRYKMMAEAGVRNISGFNQLQEKLLAEYERENKKNKRAHRRKLERDPETGEEETGEGGEPPAKLPYIVILIDELADLMMVASKGVEESLTRLAQMARAAGIHLIVATQRPSVDVLTGIIKANFPARISYKVTSRVDSRTILDTMGADKLLGKGDMLFLPPGTSRLLRIHGAMVSDAEIHRIVNFIKRQKQPDYQEDIFQASVEDTSGQQEEEFDEKYDEALALVAKDRQASISYIQRRLRIGYNRAARIIETMEKEGVVGPSDGIKPREVYVKPILFE
ncbi:MAG: DNA translocase FtsK [Nitrospinaceae bacterium]